MDGAIDKRNGVRYNVYRKVCRHESSVLFDGEKERADKTRELRNKIMDLQGQLPDSSHRGSSR